MVSFEIPAQPKRKKDKMVNVKKKPVHFFIAANSFRANPLPVVATQSHKGKREGVRSKKKIFGGMTARPRTHLPAHEFRDHAFESIAYILH